MRVLLLCALVSWFLGATTGIADSNSHYTLYLVRHAEKQADGSRDPVLTEAGIHRAEQLAGWLQDKDIEDIWSSDYHRTRDTAKPLLAKLNRELNIYDPGDQSILVNQLNNRKKTALVVGHSNTIPELARLLCECNIADMEDSEYDRLIVLSIDGDVVESRTLQQDFLFRR